MKTSDLIDLPLDYAVAVAEGGTGLWNDTCGTWWINIGLEDRALKKGWAQAYLPSTDWSQGGPIIEREAIEVGPAAGHRPNGTAWCAHLGNRPESRRCYSHGPTPLIAAMRCYVASKLGDEVDVPKELLS